MSASGSWNESSEDFMLVASGPKQYAPFLVDWQEFKDHIRKVVRGQPKWTEVTPGQRRGEMQGWCRLDTKDDAEAAYEYYVRTRGVLVHLFQTSRNSGDYLLLKCNCWPHFPDISERSHSPRRSGIDMSGVHQHHARMSGVVAPQYMMPAVPSAPMYQYAMYQQAPTYTTPPAFSTNAVPMQLAAPQATVYSTTTSGIPVNVRHGAVLTEARGIFIQNLSYAVGPSELNALLSSVGRPVECKLHRDQRTGSFKGAATAKFATKEEAQYAAAQLNGRQHMDMTIHVRMDTDTTVVGKIQAPVIVNGSNLPRY